MTVNFKKIWRYAEWGIVIAIALFIAWKLFFQPLGNSNNAIYKEVSKYNDEKIKAIEGERDGWKAASASKDTTISLLNQQMVFYQNNLIQSQQILKKLDAKLQDLPLRIDRLLSNKDSLRRAAEE
jgi:hypothetical protein